MKIIKKAELGLGCNSYMLSKIGKQFIINRTTKDSIGNYCQQFLMVDQELKIASQPIIDKENTQIYQIFSCNDDNRFLIDSSDSSMLLYGNFAENVIFTVDITSFGNKYFAYAYLWLKDSIILASNESFYELEISTKRFKEIEVSKAKEFYGDFYKFQTECNAHMPIKQADFIKQIYIYKENYLKFDGSTQNIVYVDLKNNKVKKIEDPYNNYHDVIFHKGYFILIAKKALTIIKDKKTYTLPMRDNQYFFARAAGIDDSENLAFIVLECGYSYEKNSRLVRYELS